MTNEMRPGVLAVMRSLTAIVLLHEGNLDAEVNDLLEQADEARATVEKMAGALAAVRMLRQLGGMMHGSREVVLIACDAADEALAEFEGTTP